MSHQLGIPKRALNSLIQMVDHDAQVQPGMEVIILAHIDGLYGSDNWVDEQAISWMQAVVQSRGANCSVLWIDEVMKAHEWRLPPVVKGAIANAIRGAHTIERELKGSELLGWIYRGPFDELAPQQGVGCLDVAMGKIRHLMAGAEQPAVHELHRSKTTLAHLNPGVDLGVLEQNARMNLTPLHQHADLAAIRAGVDHQGIGGVVTCGREVESDPVTQAEAVREHLPVGAGKLESNPIFLGEGNEFLGPEGPEVDIFDPSHVEALVHEDAHVQGLSVQAPNQVPPTGVCPEVHRIPGIDQEHINDRAVVANTSNAPGVGNGLGGVLLRIEDRDPFEDRIRVKKETTVWAHASRRMGVNVDRLVVAEAKDPTVNDWDVYISLKVKGPAYVQGSTDSNGLWMDRVLLVRPPK